MKKVTLLHPSKADHFFTFKNRPTYVGDGYMKYNE